MKPIWIIGIIALVIVLVFLFLRSRVSPIYLLQQSDLANVYSEFKEKSKQSSFMVLMFKDPADPNNSYINLQYSKDKNKIGLDWVLISPKNIKEKDNIKAYIENRKHIITEQEINQTKFLRTEDGDLLSLGSDIIYGYFKLPADQKIETIIQGYKTTIIPIKK